MHDVYMSYIIYVYVSYICIIFYVSFLIYICAYFWVNLIPHHLISKICGYAFQSRPSFYGVVLHHTMKHKFANCRITIPSPTVNPTNAMTTQLYWGSTKLSNNCHTCDHTHFLVSRYIGKIQGYCCINEYFHEFCHITVQMCISSPEVWVCTWICLLLFDQK